jgi:uncharacterized protein
MELAFKVLDYGISNNDNECREALSLFYKKAGDTDKSLELWQKIIEYSKDINFFAYEEIAKYYEHKMHDYEKALEFVKSVLEKFETLRSLDRYIDDSILEKFKKRKNRLLRKTAIFSIQSDLF